MNKLEKALSRLLKNSEFISYLAPILAHASEKSIVSYREVAQIANDDADDVLLLGNEWRLLLPVRTVKSAAWEDRLLLFEPGESYEMPNIIRYIVEEASKTGHWDSERAITKIFRDMGEPSWGRMPKLIEQLEAQSKNHRVNAIQIKKICSELGLGDRVDALIAGLKASGVVSPKLGSLAEVSQAGSPLYELNPSLFLRKGEKK
jgi:hypothetical protein